MRRKPKTKEQALLVIRAELRTVGVNVDALSDEQIEQAVTHMAETLAKVGVTMRQASDSIEQAVKAIGLEVRS